MGAREWKKTLNLAIFSFVVYGCLGLGLMTDSSSEGIIGVLGVAMIGSYMWQLCIAWNIFGKGVCGNRIVEERELGNILA